ncbi:PapB/FocB family fimbrial expression transcriptional regulator [Escherichia albertii]|uniref:PapB/FocB family fimbrial expression transcriptional regulator n=1 Tax=Escherichia albertii TaxID=208962 RepID=UPI000C15E8D7|nr:PapB/FocB family fimbrial expression transcriptional regulator [Escherichia albertii]
MQARYFELILELTPVYSERVIDALRDFLVMGVNRKEACFRNDVSLAYFSIVLKKFKHAESVVYKIHNNHAEDIDELPYIRRVFLTKKKTGEDRWI